ncbi:hypothetical protein QBC46DRAFT_397157 [Diplogelasinospora grovesii]|uniref:F-box domain-containing protein n=1 Tax=Diplogelasinospora grovesii TaxID=303347 RepID=A0AAN6S0J8_9PEZI|nr:hypothetical protein QBC46DRAFT_397157 [Diplogelasinospora grovesii]
MDREAAATAVTGAETNGPETLTDNNAGVQQEWCADAPSCRVGNNHMSGYQTIWTEKHVIDVAKMHPLMAATYHNHTSSPLGRLPTAVLARLMQLVDPVTRECLRRTSRVFLQLFATACLSVEGVSVCLEKLSVHPWPISRPTLSPDEHSKLCSLLAKDNYCSSCLAARQATDWQESVRKATGEYLHCSGCRIDHPACLFSPAQRRSPQSTRICIGHEGFLRLCEHKTISWSLIISLSESIMNQKCGPRYRTIKCKHSSHTSACRWRWRSLRGIASENIQYQDKGWDCNPKYPTLTVGYKETKNFHIWLAWSPHLSVAKGLQDDGPLTPQILERDLAMLREKEARFICPEFEPGQIVESRLFDPNSCDCLKYKGMDKTRWKRLSEPQLRPPLLRPCRLDRTRCLTPLVRAQMTSGRRRSVGARKWHRNEQHGQGWRSRHIGKDGTEEPLSAQMQRVTVLPCLRGRECIQLNYKRRWCVGDERGASVRHMNGHWFSALDPDSYELTEDEDGVGVYWCKERSCRNFYRYTRSRIRPLLKWEDYRHPCPS